MKGEHCGAVIDEHPADCSDGGVEAALFTNRYATALEALRAVAKGLRLKDLGNICNGT